MRTETNTEKRTETELLKNNKYVLFIKKNKISLIKNNGEGVYKTFEQSLKPRPNMNIHSISDKVNQNSTRCITSRKQKVVLSKEFLDIRNQQKFLQEKNIKKQQIFNGIEEAAFYAQKLICHGENEEEIRKSFFEYKKEMLLKIE